MSIIMKHINLLLKYRGIFKELSWTLVSQVIGNLLRFLLIFIVVRCYTQEEFGLWASITSIAAVIVTGDFGLTNVLRNIASKGLTRGKEGEIYTKEAWFSAFVALTIFAIIGIFILYTIKDYSIFSSLFKTDNSQLKELGNWVTVVTVGIFLIGLPLGLTGGLYLSYGEVKESSIFSIISGVLTFVVVVSLSLKHVRIDFVSIAFFLCPLCVSFISTLYFLHRREWYSFSISPKMIYKHVISMLPTGFCFLGIDFSRNFIPSALTIYSGALLGLSVAANINVATKVYSFFMSIMVSLLNPIWARLSKLYYSGEYANCRKMMKVNLLSMFGTSIVVIFLATLFRDYLVLLIAGDEYEADFLVFILVGGCLIGKAIYDSSSLLLIATSKLNIILPGYLIFSIVAMFIFPIIVEKYGFNWMMIIMILCWTIFIVSILYQTKIELSKTERTK